MKLEAGDTLELDDEKDSVVRASTQVTLKSRIARAEMWAVEAPAFPGGPMEQGLIALTPDGSWWWIRQLGEDGR